MLRKVSYRIFWVEASYKRHAPHYRNKSGGRAPPMAPSLVLQDQSLYGRHSLNTADCRKISLRHRNTENVSRAFPIKPGGMDSGI